MTTELKNKQLQLGISGSVLPVNIFPTKAAPVSSPGAVNGITGGIAPAVDINVSAGAVPPTAPAPLGGMFDDKRDVALIAAGTHFYCSGHLRAVPVETQSRNPDYCRQCLAVLELEKARDKDSDTWAGDGEVFVNHGKRYTVHADIPKGTEPYEVEIKTYCLGDVKPQPLRTEITTSPLQTVKPVATSRTTTAGNNSATSNRKCLVCGRLITWGNSRVKYCSDPCQKKAHLQRKSVTA